MMLFLISHEHAHASECIKRGVKINSITFTWLGGMIDCDILYANDAVPILSAGVINTSCYMFASIGILVMSYLIRLLGLTDGMNYAMTNPIVGFAYTVVGCVVILTLTNVLPINYHHKTYGLISTDGWAALRFRTLRDELWNDGKNMIPVNL
jgi:hypothetical protein